MSDEEVKASPVVSLKSLNDAEPADPRRVLRKLDWHLLPFISLLYLLAFLDRTNIGNAKIAGLTGDLGLTGLQFNLCSALFFIPYCTLVMPSNLALKYFKPSRWIPLIMFCWSIILICMAFVKNYAGLLMCASPSFIKHGLTLLDSVRIFLGIAEAGLFPGLTFYVCLWYPRSAQAGRLSIYMSAATAAGAFGGILAYGIERMNGIGGLAGWSWIFLLEGLFTALVAIAAFFYMQDFPETATFLTPAERDWLVQTLKEDTAASSKVIKREYLIQALKNPHAYILACIDFFIVVAFYAFALFLPTIIVGLGYSSLHAQLLTVPPNICGCIFTVLFGTMSDRVGMRGPFVLLGALLSLVGYVMLFTTTSPIVGYVGTLIAACGLNPSSACAIAWVGGNSGGDVKRGSMIAIVSGIGNSGAIVASFIYRSQDSPRYHPGHATNIAASCIVATMSIVAMFEFSRMNREKHAYCVREGIEADRIEEFHELGDKSPLYRWAHLPEDVHDISSQLDDVGKVHTIAMRPRW
ncbi:uncharacterized protein FIBRA_00023 [Fibroporia radiculosa]|uniref:Major facilitator superfamily (MFS) profile domain-containing protein n=1 Tax=Fibroporia radiculosa TaxID=599839 RepID=J7RUP1_9APHY|nr:uncharacterized protein FIBRA_00023 [Fibroporia radiculosa]CCL98030.1 predicted protein [Fibroporia radiculosa]